MANKSLSGAMNVLKDLKTINDYTNNSSKTEKVTSQNQSNNDFLERITLIDTKYIRNWELKDRPQNELGDIDSLANEFSEIGQQIPCIVRPLKNVPPYKYELIAGERRLKAAIIAKVQLKVIIKELSDAEAAIVQLSENNNRKNLSDYAKGISYSKIIEKGLFTQTDLIKKIGLNKVAISRLLSFRNIPTSIVDSIGDMTKVSARTASTIVSLSNKGDDYVKCIMNHSKLLKTGKVGHEKLKRIVELEINKESNDDNIVIFNYKTDNIIFKWHQYEKRLNISYSEKLKTSLSKNKLEELTNELKKCIINFIE